MVVVEKENGSPRAPSSYSSSSSLLATYVVLSVTPKVSYLAHLEAYCFCKRSKKLAVGIVKYDTFGVLDCTILALAHSSYVVQSGTQKVSYLAHLATNIISSCCSLYTVGISM